MSWRRRRRAFEHMLVLEGWGHAQPRKHSLPASKAFHVSIQSTKDIRGIVILWGLSFLFVDRPSFVSQRQSHAGDAY